MLKSGSMGVLVRKTRAFACSYGDFSMFLKRTFGGAASVLVLSGALVSSAVAGPLDRSLVSADASWVAHVDVEAFAGSEIAKVMLDAGLSEQLAEMKAEVGIDLLKDALGITIYGAGGDPKEGTILISATGNIDAVLAGLSEEADEYEQVTVNGQAFDSWAFEDGRMYSFTQKQGEKRLVVAAEDLDSVQSALKVVNGESSNLTNGKGEGRLVTSPGESAWVYVTSNDLGSLPLPPEAQMMTEGMRGFSLELGETAAKEIKIALSVVNATVEAATELQGMLNMGLGMARGQAGTDPETAEALKMLDSLKISTDGAKLSISLALDPAMLAEMADKWGSVDEGSAVYEDGDAGDDN